jgi:pimeloyl-ACP methyl ester carboxylesterase
VGAAILCSFGLLLAGCFSDSASDGEDNIGPTDPTSGNGAPTTPPPGPATGFRAQFQPLNGIFPYPNDLYFSGSTDGTLNLPANPFQPTVATINALDGYSTTAYWSIRFAGGALDPATFSVASIRVIRIQLDNATKGPLVPPAPGATVAPAPLILGQDFSASVSTEAGSAGGTLIIRPLRPLQASTGATNIGYLVLLTKGIRATAATGGAEASPDADYRTVRDQAISEIAAGAQTPTCTPITNSTLNAICRLTFGHLRVGAGVGQAMGLPLNLADVIVSFSFSTESTRDTLGAVAGLVAAAPAPAAVTLAPLPGPPPNRLDTRDVIAALQGKADLFAGTLTVPYYLSAPTTANPLGPVNRFWTAAGAPQAPGLDPASRNLTRFNPVPLKTEDRVIPLLVLVPNAASTPLVPGCVAGQPPPGGWPVAVFQHGLTRNRGDAIAIADAFADACFVVVSIDLPLHGITPTNPLAPVLRQAANERTFDLDVSNNTTLAPGPDGVIDNSGQNFVNLSSLLTTRDNLRQGAADLLTLTRALATLELTGDSTADINASRIHFVGHSLGAIVGGSYAAVGTGVRSASLLMVGGGVAQTIVDSPTFGPAIKNALASQGLIEGTTLYNQFLRDAQTAADAGDPINYFSALLTAKPVHVTQVNGDTVVPNSSTQRLIAAGVSPTGAPLIRKVSAVGPNPTQPQPGNGGYVNFTAGNHGTIIDPTASLAATVEMQSQVVQFAASNGAAIVITNTAVIEP